MASDTARVPELDGLRGIAILLVLLSHFGHSAFKEPAWQPWRQVLRSGWVGVDLFFVLSGYLITGILLRARGEPGALARFYARRALRIWPLYLAACALILLVVPAIGLATQDEARWLAAHRWWYWGHLTNVMGELRSYGGAIHTGHFWSLAVEEQFYLAWPWLVLGASLATIRRAVPAIAAASLALWLVRGTYGLSPWLSVGLYVLPLAAGAMVALHLHDRGSLAPLERPALRVGVAALLVLAMLAVVGRWVDPGRAMIPLGARPVLTVLFTCGLILLLARPAGRLARVCRTRWLVRLGVISYGLYVIHNPLRTLLPRLGVPVDALTGGGLAGRLAYLGVMLAISCMLAGLSWRYFEGPFLRLRERSPRHDGLGGRLDWTA